MTPSADICGSHNTRTFAAWAEVYDKQENPMLRLEERYLSHLLPDLRERHILDLGCGTGRWLERFVKAGGASSLHGIDSSQEMLQIASNKLPPEVLLTRSELPLLPLSSASADLVIASFVLSYVEHLELCAFELARVMQDGADLFLSDVHPETAAVLGWQRGFATNGVQHRLKIYDHSIHEITEAFCSHGFALVENLEPSFGEDEHALFIDHGKEMAWQKAAHRPAIYLLHFRKLSGSEFQKDNSKSVLLHGMECAFGPSEFASASLTIQGGVIASISAHTNPSTEVEAIVGIDLHGYLILPGLVNAHDHLEFGLFPRLGHPPYGNAAQWAMDIQMREAETIAFYRRIPKEARLWWGGIRNLLCGVTTVCHHNPFDPVFQDRYFPSRVIDRYGWDHSLTFGSDIPSALKETALNEPFFIHAGEGIDEEAATEFSRLDLLGAIEERTILIHGLAFEKEEIELLNQRGASLVICPSSNEFLFEKRHPSEQLRLIERLALGSDSPLTAKGDLLEEVRFANKFCNLKAEEIYRLVTNSSADLLKCKREEGALKGDAVADIIAVRRRPGTPAEILAELSWRDIELVLIGGRVFLASPGIFERLPEEMSLELLPFNVEGEVRWLPASSFKMLQAAESVLGTGKVKVGGLAVSCTEPRR